MKQTQTDTNKNENTRRGFPWAGVIMMVIAAALLTLNLTGAMEPLRKYINPASLEEPVEEVVEDGPAYTIFSVENVRDWEVFTLYISKTAHTMTACKEIYFSSVGMPHNPADYQVTCESEEIEVKILNSVIERVYDGVSYDSSEILVAFGDAHEGTYECHLIREATNTDITFYVVIEP